MAFNNPDATFAEQAERVFALYQQIADVRDKHGTAETDSRRVSLNNIMMAANAAMAILRLLAWAKSGGEVAMIDVLGLSKPEYIDPLAEDMLRSSRLFLLIEAHFQTETLFRNILLALRKPAGKHGFYNVAQDVLTAAGTVDLATKLRVVNVPALMRNSMHANGIHHGWKGTSTIEIIKGVEFRFEHGKRVQCGSWYHIVTALSASVEVVDEILSSPVTRAFTAIPDIYAEQAALDAK